jgi:serine/threonine-protein phosphatase 2A regulatory subunit B
VLSAVEFDDTGDFLATGDKGGRIVVFERADAGRVSGPAIVSIGVLLQKPWY